MAINVFGIKLLAEKIHEEEVFNELIKQAVKNNDERKLFLKILNLDLSDGSTLINHLKNNCVRQGSKNDQYSAGVYAAVFADIKKQLTVLKTEKGISIFQDLVLQVLEAESDEKVGKYALTMRKGEVYAPEQLPKNFPGQYKKAEALVEGKLRSDINQKDVENYEYRQRLRQKIMQLAKMMFEAINFGLNENQTKTYVRVVYELDGLQTALPTNPVLLKKIILEGIKRNQQIELIHIKCLRFVYPQGERLELVDHLREVKVVTKNGDVHCPKGETQIINRLESLVKVLRQNGLNVQLTILLSDQDLHDYFPKGGGGVVSDADIFQARLSMERYKQEIQQNMADGKLAYLREYMQDAGILSDFETQRIKIIESLKSGRGVLPEGLVESRVNYRYESNRRILKKDPGRQFARERVYEQLASLIALGVLNNNKRILVEDDKGDENQIIGGVKKDALPVVFIKLRDEI